MLTKLITCIACAISINASFADSANYPPYQLGTTYKGGDKVTAGGKLYLCKPGVSEGCTIGIA